MPDGGLSSTAVRRRRVATITLVATTCVLAPLVVVALALVALSAALRPWSNVGQRTHLTPIPIAAEACPYVIAMHQAAGDYQAVFPVFGVLSAPNGQPLSWSEARARVGHAADVLESWIIVGSPHFPAAVERYLAMVRHDLDAGRQQLRLAQDGSDFFLRVAGLQHDGQEAFGYAGDLIGTQCGVPLGV